MLDDVTILIIAILLTFPDFDDSKLPIIVCCVEIAFVIVIISIPELIKLCHRYLRRYVIHIRS